MVLFDFCSLYYAENFRILVRWYLYISLFQFTMSNISVMLDFSMLWLVLLQKVTVRVCHTEGVYEYSMLQKHSWWKVTTIIISNFHSKADNKTLEPTRRSSHSSEEKITAAACLEFLSYSNIFNKVLFIAFENTVIFRHRDSSISRRNSGKAGDGLWSWMTIYLMGRNVYGAGFCFITVNRNYFIKSVIGVQRYRVRIPGCANK